MKQNKIEHLAIWGDSIPGNSIKRKNEVMEIKVRKNPSKVIDTIRWVLALKGDKYRDKKKLIDTYTATWVFKTDDSYRETFEDIPYLIPFISEGSKQAVIVVPGGGYCTKEMANEGSDVAEQLQKNGITAFVLWYRSNPYYQPYPLMDMQRAIRYVRYHAKEYGYDEDKISAIGFSAGGLQVGLFSNILQGNASICPAYQKDDIDLVDDHLNRIAMIYSALNYRNNISMMFASFSAEDVRNKEKRLELLETYDAIKHMKCTGIPHFISYGTKDDLINPPQVKEYIEILKNTKTSFREVPVEGAGHGYGAAVGKKEGFWLEQYIDWLKDI